MWNDLLNGGQLGGQMQGDSGMGFLEQAMMSRKPRDFLMRLMWGQQGQRMPRHTPSAPDQWKEMLERQMWQHINRQPTPQMGVRGHPYQNMNRRPPNPMGVLGPRS